MHRAPLNRKAGRLLLEQTWHIGGSQREKIARGERPFRNVISTDFVPRARVSYNPKRPSARHETPSLQYDLGRAHLGDGP